MQHILNLMKNKMSNYEVQGFGKVVIQDGVALLVDIDLPVQEAESAHIKTSAEELQAWRRKRFKLKPKMTEKEVAAANEEMQSWKLWFHSHPNMTPTYSSTDNETLQDLAEESGSMFIGLCVDHNMKNTVYVAYSRPIHTGVLKFEEPATIEYTPSTDDVAAIEKMFEESVSKKVYAQQSNTPMGTGMAGMTGTQGSKRRAKNADKQPEGTFVKYLVDKNATVMKRGCSECMGMLVVGAEQYRDIKGTLTVKNGVAICVDCEIEEGLCMCLDTDSPMMQYAAANGWLLGEDETQIASTGDETQEEVEKDCG